MIDVMLVLLIIVLISASFYTKENLSLNLPSAKNSQTQPSKAHNTLSVLQDGTMYFNKKKVTIHALKQELETQKDVLTIIQADKDVSFGVFVDLIDLFKSTNQNQIQITTRRKQ